MEKGRWGLLQANFRKRRLFYSNKFNHLALYNKKGGDDFKIHTTQAHNLQTYIFNNI